MAVSPGCQLMAVLMMGFIYLTDESECSSCVFIISETILFMWKCDKKRHLAYIMIVVPSIANAELEH